MVRADLSQGEMVDDTAEANVIDRGRKAARAWLEYLRSTSLERWEQEWKLEELLRLEPAAD